MLGAMQQAPQPNRQSIMTSLLCIRSIRAPILTEITLHHSEIAEYLSLNFVGEEGINRPPETRQENRCYEYSILAK